MYSIINWRGSLEIRGDVILGLVRWYKYFTINEVKGIFPMENIKHDDV